MIPILSKPPIYKMPDFPVSPVTILVGNNTDGLSSSLRKINLVYHRIAKVIDTLSMSVGSEIDDGFFTSSYPAIDWCRNSGSLSICSSIKFNEYLDSDLDLIVNLYPSISSFYWTNAIIHETTENWRKYRTNGIERRYYNKNINEKLLPYLDSLAEVANNPKAFGFLTSFKGSTVSIEARKFYHSLILELLLKAQSLLKEAETDLKKKIKRLRRILHNSITLDIRYHIRTIIRSLRITPFDGKDADSVFSCLPITSGNHFSTFFNLESWVINRTNYSSLIMPLR